MAPPRTTTPPGGTNPNAKEKRDGASKDDTGEGTTGKEESTGKKKSGDDDAKAEEPAEAEEPAAKKQRKTPAKPLFPKQFQDDLHIGAKELLNQWINEDDIEVTPANEENVRKAMQQQMEGDQTLTTQVFKLVILLCQNCKEKNAAWEETKRWEEAAAEEKTKKAEEKKRKKDEEKKKKAEAKKREKEEKKAAAEEKQKKKEEAKKKKEEAKKKKEEAKKKKEEAKKKKEEAKKKKVRAAEGDGEVEGAGSGNEEEVSEGDGGELVHLEAYCVDDVSDDESEESGKSDVSRLIDNTPQNQQYDPAHRFAFPPTEQGGATANGTGEQILPPWGKQFTVTRSDEDRVESEEDVEEKEPAASPGSSGSVEGSTPRGKQFLPRTTRGKEWRGGSPSGDSSESDEDDQARSVEDQRSHYSEENKEDTDEDQSAVRRDDYYSDEDDFNDGKGESHREEDAFADGGAEADEYDGPLEGDQDDDGTDRDVLADQVGDGEINSESFFNDIFYGEEFE